MFAAGRALPFVAHAVSYAASIVTIAATRASFQVGPRVMQEEHAGGVTDGLKWLWRAPFPLDRAGVRGR